MAITAALKKFAPFHGVRVVPTLAEAEELLGTLPPELLVIDLDPPPLGDMAFFNRLRMTCPEARALVIATGISRKLQAARGTAGAIRFMEKPFELPEFGAAVQALLGPWTDPPAAQRRGTLRDLGPVDIAQLGCLAQKTAVVRIETDDGQVGEIHFQNGEILHASAEELTGRAALEVIAQWTKIKIREEELPAGVPRTINQPWEAVLLEIVGDLEPAAEAPWASPEPAAPRLPGKTILVIDDTEMLLIFAADVLATGDPSLQVITASTGREGLKLAAEKQPDLVLLDYSLTDMNGSEVCRELLAQKATACIPVLMMSGHLPELANTASLYGNVVATLPKPFLSGALIDWVEKLLAAGPLPEAPASPPPVQPEIPAVVSRGPPALSNGNGHGSAAHGGFQSTPPPEPPTSPTALLESSPHAITPRFFQGAATELREVTATFACEVVTVRLASDFRMGALQLKLAEATLTAQMNEGDGQEAAEKDFLLGPTLLDALGAIQTLQIMPTTRSEHVSPSKRDFAVDRISAEPVPGGRLVELTGATGAVMRVRLIAQFRLLRVDLSPTFEVALAVLELCSNRVRVQTGATSAVAMEFYIHDVELNEAERLTGLTVGSRP